MPYELLFSRNRSNDVPVVWDDIEILESSLMIDALSILSQFRRSAGWLYPVRPTGTGSFERGQGRLILFGKTRVNFPDFPPPYYLEFFPRFGCSTYVLSVYKGDPSVPSHDWVQYPPSGREFKLVASPPGIQTREVVTLEALFDAAEGAIEGHIYLNYLYWKMSDNTMFKREIGTWNPVTLVSMVEYSGSRNGPGVLIL
jgi:hypothetical protein